jgi:DegV family protein with EDD domain
MKKVLVVTDSSATVPADQVQELGIRVVPILLNMSGQTYRDGIDITPDEVYRWLRTNKHLPTTAAPSAGDFLRVYASAADEASGIVSIHLPHSIPLSTCTEVGASAGRRRSWGRCCRSSR